MDDQKADLETHTYLWFLNEIIERGIASCEQELKDELLRVSHPFSVEGRKKWDHYHAVYEGNVAGFNACRGQTPVGILELLKDFGEVTLRAYAECEDDIDSYWRLRHIELQIEWVANVLSAGMLNSGFPVLVNPTSRGVMQAARILGVRGQ